MKTYKLDFGWEMDFPDDWIHEVGEKGVDMFYPPDDSTTAYASVFTAARNGDGEPAPAEILEDFFVKSLSAHNAEEIPLSVEGLGCRAFFCVDNKGIYRVSVGVFTVGNLLSLNVYSENEETVYRVAEEQFAKVRFNGG
ncbi:MAG: hypothetical protein K2N56_12995 [Oscillospiraceae bacterium]|nr:hypothetical protein [Oscillospiraceae bacterium]